MALGESTQMEIKGEGEESREEKKKGDEKES
jgi:hypothetical protein